MREHLTGRDYDEIYQLSELHGGCYPSVVPIQGNTTSRFLLGSNSSSHGYFGGNAIEKLCCTIELEGARHMRYDGSLANHTKMMNDCSQMPHVPCLIDRRLPNMQSLSCELLKASAGFISTSITCSDLEPRTRTRTRTRIRTRTRGSHA